MESQENKEREHCMSIARDRLETALSLIKHNLKEGTDKWRWYTTSTFDKFSSDIEMPLMYSKIVIDEKLKERYARMLGRLQPIDNDLNTLLSMLDQANWQKEMVRQGHLDTEHNLYYGTALVDAFITKYRSSYDTIAKALIEIRRDRGKPPRNSFTKLREICKLDDGVKILDEDLANLIQLCDWYDPLLKARKGIIHDNLQSSGFHHPRIVFQIYKYDECKRRTKLIDIPGVMASENLVDFELYAALQIGYTYWLLEKFAKLGYDILQVTKYPDSETRMVGHPGLGVFKDSNESWLQSNQS